MTEHNRLITAGSRVRLRLAADDRLVTLVRRGDTAAFEVLYERHSRGLLSFCVYMLGSKHDAEDAVQATFASAYRALRADRRPVTLRPWLFTIARNDCLSILRKRHPTVELNGEPALGGDPVRELELREEVRHTLDGLRELPEKQRAALILAELHGLSQLEIGGVLGVEPEQVKAYVYQARSNLISARRAREVDCREIREELATARGAALLRGRLRRHMRGCADCRAYADGVARQRRQLLALLPLAPSLLLKYRVLEEALGVGGADPATYAGGVTVAGSMAGAAAEVASGGVKALAVKMAAGVALLGASAGVGASVIGIPITPQEPAPAGSVVTQPAIASLMASVGEQGRNGDSPSDSAFVERTQVSLRTQAGSQGDQAPTSPTEPGPPSITNGGGLETGLSTPDGSGQTPSGIGEGKGEVGQAPQSAANRAREEARQKESEEDERQSEERQEESEEDQRQHQERAHERDEREQQRLEGKKLREEHIPWVARARRRQKKNGGSAAKNTRRSAARRPPRTEEELREKREKQEQHAKEHLAKEEQRRKERQAKEEQRRRERKAKQEQRRREREEKQEAA